MVVAGLHLGAVLGLHLARMLGLDLAGMLGLDLGLRRGGGRAPIILAGGGRCRRHGRDGGVFGDVVRLGLGFWLGLGVLRFGGAVVDTRSGRRRRGRRRGL